MLLSILLPFAILGVFGGSIQPIELTIDQVNTLDFSFGNFCKSPVISEDLSSLIIYSEHLIGYAELTTGQQPDPAFQYFCTKKDEPITEAILSKPDGRYISALIGDGSQIFNWDTEDQKRYDPSIPNTCISTFEHLRTFHFESGQSPNEEEFLAYAGQKGSKISAFATNSTEYPATSPSVCVDDYDECFGVNGFDVAINSTEGFLAYLSRKQDSGDCPIVYILKLVSLNDKNNLPDLKYEWTLSQKPLGVSFASPYFVTVTFADSVQQYPVDASATYAKGVEVIDLDPRAKCLNTYPSNNILVAINPKCDLYAKSVEEVEGEASLYDDKLFIWQQAFDNTFIRSTYILSKTVPEENYRWTFAAAYAPSVDQTPPYNGTTSQSPIILVGILRKDQSGYYTDLEYGLSPSA